MARLFDIPREPFTLAEARKLGWPRHVVEDRIADGSLRRVLRNVYQSSEVPDTIDHRAQALALVANPVGVFCDRTAAWLHGVDIYEYRELEILPPLDCFVLRDRHRIDRPECRGGERDLAPYDICAVGGLRVTTPLRTALDLGCLLPRPDGLAGLDMFMRKHGVTRADLEASLPRYRRRRGVVKLRGLVPLADARSESARESRARLAVLDAGIPAPELQYWVCQHGVPIFRLDLAWPKSRVALEYDGEEWHDRTAEQRNADHKRRNWLIDHGWTVIVLKKGSFAPDARDSWLGELIEALRLPH